MLATVSGRELFRAQATGWMTFFPIIANKNVNMLRAALESQHFCAPEGCFNCNDPMSLRDDVVKFIAEKDFECSERTIYFTMEMSRPSILGNASEEYGDYKSTYIPHSMRVLLSYVELNSGNGGLLFIQRCNQV